VRIAGRNTQGVRVFKTDADEKVESVEHIPDEGDNGEDDEGGENESPASE
jgi:DNA gyrase subunit A